MNAVAAVVTAVCKTATTIVKTVRKVIAKLLTPMIRLVGAFVPTPPEHLSDEVGNLAGVNFDRWDEQGNLIPFIWGVSTSSLQVEGGIENSDWHLFVTSPSTKRRVKRLGRLGRTTLRIEPAGRAVDHRNLDVLAEDLDRARLLGCNAYRFSLEWSRIQPHPPQWATDYISARREAEDLGAETDGLRSAASVAEGRGEAWEAERPRTEAARLEARAAGARKRAESLGAEAPYHEDDFDRQAVEHYVKMSQLMRERGLQPILTLEHMSLPAWVSTPPVAHDFLGLGAVEDDRFRGSLRGWENPVTVKAYLNFVRFVAPLFRDHVQYWCTLNEPVASVAVAGYAAGIWPPGFLGDGNRARAAVHNHIEAHARAYELIKEFAGSQVQVGLCHWVAYPRAAPASPIQRLWGGDNEAAKNQWRYAFTYYFLDAVTFGHFNRDISQQDEPEINPHWANRLDFIAPQYYRAVDVYHDILVAFGPKWLGGRFVADLRGRKNYLRDYLWNDLGWTIYPGGLYRILVDLYGRYRRPILITENGMGEAQDRNRAAYTLSHLQQVLRAIRHGVAVVGYVHWSIVDNWEWAFGYQDAGRFGLFTVDRNLPEGAKTFPRHITEGALAYQYVIANSHRITETDSKEDPFEAVLARFGAYSPDGLSLQPPCRSAGLVWQCMFDGDRRPPFRLYMSALPRGHWLGMVFLTGLKQWMWLENIKRHGPGGEPVHLEFQHHLGDFVAQYSIWPCPSDESAGGARVEGTVTIGDEEFPFTGARDDAVGIWRDGRGAPFLFALGRLEGGYDSWKAKYYRGRRDWVAAEGVSVANGQVIAFLEGADFKGRISGDALTGEVRKRGSQGESGWTFQGQRLPFDDPFA